MGMVSKYTVSCWEEVSIQMGNHKYKLLPTIYHIWLYTPGRFKTFEGLGTWLDI